MPRLFTGILLTETVGNQLTVLQPRPLPGLRLVKTGQMHLTLHFIGEGTVEQYRPAMVGLKLSVFTLVIDSLGRFANRQGTILWAGVREEPALLQLHRELETALVAAGYRAEKRAYHPHLTLARCDRRVPGKVIEAFVKQSMEPIEVSVNEVVLFSSELSPQGPTYHQELVIPLR